jgi:hypothetical protein
MTHSQVLESTVSKIIHTAAQEWRTSFYLLVIVSSVDMVRYNVQQHASLYESRVKCGSPRRCRGKCKISGEHSFKHKMYQ